MPNWLRRMFNTGDDRQGGKEAAAGPNSEEEVFDRWYKHKSALMEKSLGKEHNLVQHAIIGWAMGGGLDLYYYPNGLPGTAIATKELSELPNQGPSNRVWRTYELVMFTRHALDLDHAHDAATEFGRAHRSIQRILNAIANYTEEAVLNPGDTCEFPADMEDIGGKCLVLAGYASFSPSLRNRFGLLAIIEVFRSEMDFAREHGAAQLFALLKAAGHYPYSDLDREPVA